MRAYSSLFAASCAVFLLSGCETYAPLPLAAQPSLASNLAALRNDGASKADLAKPLTVDAIAALAVQNNPDLVAARAERGIAEAQMLQAGLLPNPQVSGTYGVLRAGPATVDSWTAGLSEDIRALVTFSANRKAAELGARQTEADLLALMIDLHRQGRTIVAVLHDLDLVARYFPQTLLLSPTRVAWGNTSAVLPLASSRVVA